MMHYRKKPVTVEAYQFHETQGRHNGEALANWCGGYVEHVEGYRYIVIPTLEGSMRAKLGDYVIKGVKGEFYPCGEEIFLKTYDAVYDPTWEPQ